MFPLGDSTPRRTFPFVNYLIIIVCVLVFLIQLSSPDFEAFVMQFAFVPARFSFLDLTSYRYILYSLFMHGGWFHLLSNMWFLHIFGDNVEDRLGHFKYLIFYILGGFVAALSQYFLNSGDSSLPMLGASGAISAVAGAYFVLYRNSRVKTLVAFFLTVDIIELPVWFFLGYWFIIQLFSGIGSLISFQAGGVAWFAHVGGFVFGYLVARLIISAGERS